MWLKYLMQILSLAPYVVAGVEHIHAGASGASKKDIAMQSLGLASGVAGAVLPEHQAAVDAATDLASNVIDGVVNTLNAAGVLKRAKAAGSAPSPIATLPAPIAAVTAAVTTQIPPPQIPDLTSDQAAAVDAATVPMIGRRRGD